MVPQVVQVSGCICHAGNYEKVVNEDLASSHSSSWIGRVMESLFCCMITSQQSTDQPSCQAQSDEGNCTISSRVD